MKYRLKDKELQKKLDELSGGDFTRKLEDNSKRYAYEFEQYGKSVAVRVQFGEIAIHSERFNVLLRVDDVEQIQEYDPNAWNNYPEVTPPENVPMRIEVKRIGGKEHGSSFPFYGCFKDSEWIVLVGGSIHKALKKFSDFDPTYDKIRFRPWDD